MAASTKAGESPPDTHGKPKMRVARAYPALAGRQLCCGLRQSIASSRQASREAVSDTTPSFAEAR
jgi:hypothetical protein